MTMVVAISDNAHAADQAVTRLARAAFDDTVSEVILDGLSRKREFQMLAAAEPSGGHCVARHHVCASLLPRRLKIDSSLQQTVRDGQTD